MSNVKFIISLILFLVIQNLYGVAFDSLRIEKIGQLFFIIHKVEKSETLYSISRRYHADIESIKLANQLNSNPLKLGQELKIPYTKHTSSSVSLHIVQKGETLYGISKKYEVSPDDLMKLNRLTSQNLSLGQKLEIPNSTPVVTNQTINPTESKPLIEEKKQETLPIPKLSSSPYAPGKEEGFATIIETQSETDKYLALHKKAPAGTILKVTNQMNGQSIYVRVIGILPDTGINQNISLRLSKAAFDGLQSLDLKFPVFIEYYP